MCVYITLSVMWSSFYIRECVLQKRFTPRSSSKQSQISSLYLPPRSRRSMLAAVVITNPASLVQSAEEILSAWLWWQWYVGVGWPSLCCSMAKIWKSRRLEYLLILFSSDLFCLVFEAKLHNFNIKSCLKKMLHGLYSYLQTWFTFSLSQPQGEGWSPAYYVILLGLY